MIDTDGAVARRVEQGPLRILLVDDDPGFRALLKTTFEIVDIEVDEADSVDSALVALGRWRPHAVILDVNMPGRSGLELCKRLKEDPATSEIGVVLLTGSEPDPDSPARQAGADAFLLKPFSPLELLAVVERLATGLIGIPVRAPKRRVPQEQLLLYARDLRQLLQIERQQRGLLQSAYHETVSALTSALESKDTGTRAHSQRVQHYAVELAQAVELKLDSDPSAEYGFLLHDVGKIGIPDRILGKRGPLDDREWELMRAHTVVGERMLGGVAFLHGEGLRIVRSHHERWDGHGYPDGLEGDAIPLGARVFAVADTLDAITSDRPYRHRRSWEQAREEIVREAGRQFDPMVVEAFRAREPELRGIYAGLSMN